MAHVRAMVCGFVLIHTLPAFAQTAPDPSPQRRVYVDGGAFFGDRDEDFTETSSRTNGVSFTAGVFLSTRSSVRFELEIPGAHRHEWNRFYDEVEATPRTAVRTNTYSILYAYHPPPQGRLRLVWPIGLSIVRRTNQISNVHLDTGAPINDGTFTEQFTALTVGVDGEIPLTSNVAIVPSLRTHVWLVYESRFVVRPSIKVRWTF